MEEIGAGGSNRQEQETSARMEEVDSANPA
jgi:hypothetical protein